MHGPEQVRRFAKSIPGYTPQKRVVTLCLRKNGGAGKYEKEAEQADCKSFHSCS
jgi:hypothetical protein